MTQPWRDLADCVRRVYSQSGEEGIIEGIFANVGESCRYLVDIGAGDGIALSNTRFLLERGWHGARFDVNYAGDVYQERITAENVGDVLSKYNVPSDPDLLSLDVDGIDWYVLRALLRGGYRPRVMCVEFNTGLPINPPATIVYDPAFAFNETNYFGASLGAYQKLCEAYGYCLVHVHLFNAFFVLGELVPPDAVLEWDIELSNSGWPPDPQQRPWHLLTDEECR